MKLHAAVIVVAFGAPIGGTLAVPMGALAAVFLITRGFVGIEGIVIDVSRTDMRRVIAAVVVVGIIVAGIARPDARMNPRLAETIFDLGYSIPGAFAGIQEGLRGDRKSVV